MTGVTGGLALLAAVAIVVALCRIGRRTSSELAEREIAFEAAVHDLRTPIAALRALAEAAQENPAASAEIIPRVVTLAGRMGDIVDDLHSSTLLGRGQQVVELCPARLDVLVREVIDDMPPGVHRVSLAANPTVVDADLALLRRAVQNLLVNAIAHGHRPGEPASVHVTVGGGRVTVSDCGPGLRRGAPPTGLGLRIVQAVVQAHNGTLTARENERAGVTFEISLPDRTADLEQRPNLVTCAISGVDARYAGW